MRRIVSTALLLFVVIFGWSSSVLCATEPFAAEESSLADEDALLQEGIELYQAGQLNEALGLLRGYVVRYYDSPQIPKAYLYLARILQDLGQSEEALFYVSRIPPEDKSPEVQLLEGVVVMATGKVEEGLAILQGLENETFFGSDRLSHYAAIAEGHALLGRDLQALFFYSQALSLPDELAKDSVFMHVHALLERISDHELAEAVFMFRGSSVGADATVQMAWRAYDRGDESEASRLALSVLQGPVAFPYRSDAAVLMDRITGTTFLQRVVGVMLPLSGRYATFGELVKRGMDLALEEHNKSGMDLALEEHNKSGEPIRFIFRDTLAEAERSPAIVDQLVNEDRVMALAGPLTGNAALYAADQAQMERVPLLSLAQRENLPAIGDYIFRNSLTSALQVQALARYAIEEQGMDFFAILYPENKLGQEMAQLFRQEVEKYGAVVVDERSYAEDATDFRRQIKLLVGKDPDAPEEEPEEAEAPEEELTLGEGEEIEETLDDLFETEEEDSFFGAFDALFIPDYADRVGLIAPQLPFYGIEGIPLLGINGWNSPELVRLAGAYVEGAVFVDGFFSQSTNPAVREFIDLYQRKYEEEPSILEAQGFDVARILLLLLDLPEIQTREDLAKALYRLQDYPGATSTTSFNMQGEAEKELFLLQVQNGKIVQIN